MVCVTGVYKFRTVHISEYELVKCFKSKSLDTRTSWRLKNKILGNGTAWTWDLITCPDTQHICVYTCVCVCVYIAHMTDFNHRQMMMIIWFVLNCWTLFLVFRDVNRGFNGRGQTWLQEPRAGEGTDKCDVVLFLSWGICNEMIKHSLIDIFV